VSGGLVPPGQPDLDAAENEAPVIALVRRLEGDGLIDDVSLRTGDLEDLSLGQVESLLRFFSALHRRSVWWVGDLYRFAEDRWGEEASQLASATGLNLATLTRYVQLAREFPPHSRFPGLGMSHHRLVIGLDARARRAWLGRALAGDGPGEGPWTTERLRDELGLAGVMKPRDASPEPAEISNEDPQGLDVVRELRPRDTDSTTSGLFMGPSRPGYSDEWFTPLDWIGAVREVLHVIDLDPASCEGANRAVQATKYFDLHTDGLSRDWWGRAFLNPPFSRAREFVEKLLAEYRARNVKAAILLLNSQAVHAEYAQPLFDFPLCFSRGRIAFQRPNESRESRPLTGSVFAYLGPEPHRFATVFAQLGNVVVRHPRPPAVLEAT
jgi:hypothetical protein